MPICTCAANRVQSPRSKVGLGAVRTQSQKKPVDLQPLTAIQQNSFTPKPPPARNPITLTVCVTPHASTASRQHYFHRTVPLYMERRIYFAVLDAMMAFRIVRRSGVLYGFRELDAPRTGSNRRLIRSASSCRVLAVTGESVLCGPSSPRRESGIRAPFA